MLGTREPGSQDPLPAPPLLVWAWSLLNPRVTGQVWRKKPTPPPPPSQRAPPLPRALPVFCSAWGMFTFSQEATHDTPLLPGLALAKRYLLGKRGLVMT